MTEFGVSSEKFAALQIRMQQLNIREEEIQEQFVHASGPGGQNVNKVATCVVLVHQPTGTRVKCQKERQQAQNRYWARCLLLEKIENEQKAVLRRAVIEREKKRRQKRRRPANVKEMILEKKHQQSERKQQRRKINPQKFSDD